MSVKRQQRAIENEHGWKISREQGAKDKNVMEATEQ